MELTQAQMVEIARMVCSGMGIECTEQELAEMGADWAREADRLGPLTQEQRDRLYILLRPEPWRTP